MGNHLCIHIDVGEQLKFFVKMNQADDTKVQKLD